MGPNLEQLQVFVRVADGGSFSAVARELGRAQSAVSNAVAMLEVDLGCQLFERRSGSAPRLTRAGEALLAEARELLQQQQRLQGRARSLAGGEESCLRLILDEAMSYLPLLDSLESLGERHAELELQLYSGTQGDIARWVEGRRADLGLLFRQEQMPSSLERRWLGNVPLALVVGLQHPLAQAGSVSQRELVHHRQLLITPRESTYPDRERISARIWRADSLYAMAELAARNLGWALLPLHVVQYPVYREQLVALQADWAPPAWGVELVWRRDQALGPVASWLAERFAGHLQQG